MVICPSCGSLAHIQSGIFYHDNMVDGLLCKKEKGEGKIGEKTWIDLNLPPLWEKQKEAFDYAFSSNEIFIVLPTGTGKSMVGLAVANEMKVPTMVIAPTIELVKQWGNWIREYGGECTLVSSETGKEYSNFTVITYASMLLNLDRMDSYSLFIFDEAHHVFADLYRQIIQKALSLEKRKVICLTASENRMGDRAELQNRFFPIKFVWTLAERQHSDQAIDLKFIEEKITLSDEEMEKYSADWETYVGGIRKYGGFVQMARSSEGYFNPGMAAYQRIKSLLSGHPKKLRKAVDIIRSSDGNFVVFGEKISIIEQLQKMLQKENIPVVKIHAKRQKNRKDNEEQSKASRDRMIRDIRDRKVRVLLGVNAIEEGLDFPGMDNAIFLSTLSAGTIKVIQRSGRTMRTQAGKSVSIYVLYAENTKEEDNLPAIRRTIGKDYGGE